MLNLIQFFNAQILAQVENPVMPAVAANSSDVIGWVMGITSTVITGLIGLIGYLVKRKEKSVGEQIQEFMLMGEAFKKFQGPATPTPVSSLSPADMQAIIQAINEMNKQKSESQNTESVN